MLTRATGIPLGGLILASVLLTGGACPNPNNPSNTNAPLAVAVTPNELSVEVNQTSNCEATVTGRRAGDPAGVT